MQTMKRLVVEMPESQHKAIKAQALLRGMSMREYVLEKLQESRPADNDYDMEDVTESIVQALKEVGENLNGEKEPRSARAFLADLNK